ncbi:hypothetical protein [Streptomyces sp. NBC_01768]|uniref:hypothetical protein n=1 Tax=Streptomyces sp. NBC_01768 TaxID=2975938 RepID=UPI002DDBF689|nr:hypothetical protein [Streptomyces sp. NBC_01768]WSC31842.1 hypothetical protein OG902_36920 [Streptomyces sp. NBC_01768]
MAAPEGLPPVLAEAQALLDQAAADIVAKIAGERHRDRAHPLTDGEAREAARPYQGPPEWCGPIARFVATGEIVPALLDELNREQDGAHIEADEAGWRRLGQVIRYVREAGVRPPVPESPA